MINGWTTDVRQQTTCSTNYTLPCELITNTLCLVTCNLSLVTPPRKRLFLQTFRQSAEITTNLIFIHIPKAFIGKNQPLIELFYNNCAENFKEP